MSSLVYKCAKVCIFKSTAYGNLKVRSIAYVNIGHHLEMKGWEWKYGIQTGKTVLYDVCLYREMTVGDTSLFWSDDI